MFEASGRQGKVTCLLAVKSQGTVRTKELRSIFRTLSLVLLYVVDRLE